MIESFVASLSLTWTCLTLAPPWSSMVFPSVPGTIERAACAVMDGGPLLCGCQRWAGAELRAGAWVGSPSQQEPYSPQANLRLRKPSTSLRIHFCQAPKEARVPAMPPLGQKPKPLLQKARLTSPVLSPGGFEKIPCPLRGLTELTS